MLFADQEKMVIARAGVTALLIAALTSGCASHNKRDIADNFSVQAPFSRAFQGSGDNVCWSVKRAMLSQGYMLDRPNDSGVLTGERDYQPQPKLNVAVRLQTTCADNRDGTSIVFVTATREESKLQKMKQTTSLGVGPATLTMPSGSAQVLGVVGRQTIQDQGFYDDFFKLVQSYANQEQLSQDRTREQAAGPAAAVNR
jgi:Uncharacterized protein conserved in bacteria (DUF2242)